MKRIVLFCLTLVALGLIMGGCVPPLDPTATTPVDLSIPVTGVTLSNGGNAMLEAGNDLQLNSVMVPDDATTGLTWSSSSDAVASVSQTGLVHAVSPGSATITVASTKDPSINAYCLLTVAAAGSLTSIADKFTFFNQAGVNPDSTQSLPLMISNRLELNNTNIDSLVKATVEKNTMVYFNTAMSGDFRFKAMVSIKSRQMSSADRGVTIAAYAMTGGAFGTSPPMAGIMFRARGDVRSYYHTGAAYSAGSPNLADFSGADTFDVERVLEVKREAAVGYTYTITVPKTGAVVGSGSVANAGLNAAVAGTSPVYLALTAGGVDVVFSNIQIWDTIDPAATVPVYASPTVAASPVALKGISVTGPSNNPDATYEYQNAYTLMSPKTLQLTVVATPSYADNTAVTWSSSNNTVATVDAAGLVTVNSFGTATITATSQESGFTATYDINITNVTLVSGITISGANSLMAGLKVYLKADATPSSATNKAVTWASSNNSVATIDANGVVTALAAGSTNITAVATDGSGVSSAAYPVTVTAFSAPIWSWTTASPFTIGNPPVAVNGYTVSGRTATGLSFAGTGLVLANNRFVLGSAFYDTAAGGATLMASTGTVHPTGQFNFTRSAKVTITYTAGTGSLFTLYLNNNTTSDSAGSSTGSMLFQAADAAAVPPLLAISSKLYESTGTPIQAPVLSASGGTLVYTIDPAVFTKNPQTLASAYLQFRTGNGGSITITGITVEYLP